MNRQQFANITLNRFTTVHDRYQICCATCGFLFGEKSMADALLTARHMAIRHNGPGERITIYDLMAHRGKPNLWDAQGNILGRKTC